MRSRDFRREQPQGRQMYQTALQMRDPRSETWGQQQARLRLCHQTLQLTNFILNTSIQFLHPQELKLLKSIGKPSDTTHLNNLRSV